jgi:hypothetical protein
MHIGNTNPRSRASPRFSITAATDVLGFFIFLGLAQVVLVYRD